MKGLTMGASPRAFDLDVRLPGESETNSLPSPFSLEGEVALVTGGGSGIGLAIGQCLAAAGARVVLVGRREAEVVKAAALAGERAFALRWDVTDLDRADELARACEDLAGGPVSVLVNNAGIHLKKAAIDTTAQEFQAVLQTHVLAAHALTRAVLPPMMARGHGSILFIASMASLFGIPLVVAYAAAKSAHLGMVRTLAAEAGESGVRVNAIAPGWIETPMSRQAMQHDAARERKILDRTPLRRFGAPLDVGMAAVYLCSPAARFVTGAVLPVDGGASIGF
ncbi:MAG TPA: SDR family NAD(P)-dependent oxidoreductase [Opitutaceae bacterium]|jgi:gluconate 5-dehydrogenase|nr:SDR family NAD(P)-dependent oxidoreductase [Opitutaceae bacterium]